MNTRPAEISRPGGVETNGPSAFSLMEVMFAVGIFFLCSFAILQLVAGTLRNARALQQNDPDPGMLAAQLAMTNALTEGTDHGDFGKSYPGYTWSSDVYTVSSNGLFQVDYTVSRRVGRNNVQSYLSILLFRPNSPATVGPPRGVLQ